MTIMDVTERQNVEDLPDVQTLRKVNCCIVVPFCIAVWFTTFLYVNACAWPWTFMAVTGAAGIYFFAIVLSKPVAFARRTTCYLAICFPARFPLKGAMMDLPSGNAHQLKYFPVLVLASILANVYWLLHNTLPLHNNLHNTLLALTAAELALLATSCAMVAKVHKTFSGNRLGADNTSSLLGNLGEDGRSGGSKRSRLLEA